jgi:hypothetical protein
MPNLIKTPFGIKCDIPWESMPVASENCRFCSHCQKEVHDLTRLSKKEFDELLVNEPEVCGRFGLNQVAYEIVFPTKWFAKFLIPAFIFSASEIVAKDKPKTEIRQPSKANIDISENYLEYKNEISTFSNESLNTIGGGGIHVFLNRRFPFIHIRKRYEVIHTGAPMR